MSITTASVDTGLGFRDRHLRSAEFLDVDQFPAITVAGTARRVDGGLSITGALNVRGTTRTETIDVRTQRAGGAMTGSAATTIDLGSYGIRPRLGIVRPSVDLTMAGRLVRGSNAISPEPRTVRG